MSKGPSVVFRVDESIQIGFGHMSRCRALAAALLKTHAQVSFWCSNLRNVTRTSLEQSGVTVVDLLTEEAFFQQDWRETVVVVDGYQFNDVFWQRLIAKQPLRTVCIDDFRDTRYFADILVCYNEGVEAQQFQLAPKTRFFLGGHYLLLRPEILVAALLADRPVSRRAMMIVAGGTRQELWVAEMLSFIAQIEPGIPLWVLSGRSMPRGRVLHLSGVRRSQVRFFSGLDAGAMIRLYRQARCLVTPASTVLLEAFTAGCPIISGWVTDNQRNSLDWYARQGLLVNVGDLRKISGKGLILAHARARRHSCKMIRKQLKYIKDSEAGIDEIVKAIFVEL